MKKLNRKHSRLENKTTYSDSHRITHCIISTKNKYPYFDNKQTAILAMKILIQLSNEKQIPLYAYTIMPDHIHIMIGQKKDFSSIEFIRYFKGRTSAICRKAHQPIIFQKSFYDHVLRADEDIKTIAEYILHNPVRKQLSNVIGEHPYSGSTEYNITIFK